MASDIRTSGNDGTHAVPDSAPPPRRPREFVSIHNLRKVYAVDDDKVVALARINLEIPRGQICCIFGESGSGKSTLLNQMAGMEKPTKGSVHIGHNNISQMSERELAAFRQRHIGFVFQSYNLLPHLTAVENVAMPLMFCGIDKVAREAKASKMLKRVGLGKRLKHFPSQMSGGQQQRVGIARAFIAKPEVVFADEPTGNLDSKTKNEVMTMMCAFARHYRQTLVLVTHDEHMAQYADRIVTLFDGHIVGDVMTENIAVQNHDFIDTGFLRPSVSIPHITATSGDGQADLARLANANSQQQTIRAKEPRQ